jgi:hypothetical protein
MVTKNEPQGTENQPGLQNQPGMQKPEMCCDGKQTAEEHRHNSPDGKCCIDK